MEQAKLNASGAVPVLRKGSTFTNMGKTKPQSYDAVAVLRKGMTLSNIKKPRQHLSKAHPSLRKGATVDNMGKLKLHSCSSVPLLREGATFTAVSEIRSLILLPPRPPTTHRCCLLQRSCSEQVGAHCWRSQAAEIPRGYAEPKCCVEEGEGEEGRPSRVTTASSFSWFNRDLGHIHYSFRPSPQPTPSQHIKPSWITDLFNRSYRVCVPHKILQHSTDFTFWIFFFLIVV